MEIVPEEEFSGVTVFRNVFGKLWRLTAAGQISAAGFNYPTPEGRRAPLTPRVKGKPVRRQLVARWTNVYRPQRRPYAQAPTVGAGGQRRGCSRGGRVLGSASPEATSDPATRQKRGKRCKWGQIYALALPFISCSLCLQRRWQYPGTTRTPYLENLPVTSSPETRSRT